MAEQNPIKYSDLISPDDSVEKLITQLESLQTVYAGVAQAVKDKAASMAESLRMVSGATEEGRTATKNASQEADRLTKAYRDLAFARSETAKKIADLKEQQKQENMITKLTVQLNNSAAGSYNALSAQYRLNKIALNNLTAEERANVPYAKKLEEETKAIYEEMKRLQEATGKFSLNVGNYENSITNALGAQSKWFQGLQRLDGLFEGGFTNGVKAAGTAVAGFGKQLLALLMNPIVATIAAITAAFMALSKGITSSEENTNTLMRVLAPFKRIMEGVLNVIQNTATFILKVVEGFQNMAMATSRLMERLPLVGNAIKKVNDELQKSIDLEIERQRLQKEGRKLTTKEAKTQYEIAVLRRKAAQETDPNMRAAYLKKAVQKEREMSNNRVAYIQRELNVLREKARQSQNDSELNDQIAQKEAELWNARTQAEQRSLRMVSQITRLDNQRANGGGGGTKKGSSVDQAKREAAELARIQEQKDKRELSAIRAAEDAKAELIEDEYDKQRVKTILRYDREVQDLKTQMATLGDDEVNTKKAINDQIIALEQQKWDKLADIAQKEMDDAYSAEQKDYERRIKAADQMVKEKENAEKEMLRKEKEIQEERKRAISDALSYAMDSLYEYLAAWQEMADKQREKADEQVESAKNVVEKEIEARNNGYAANVALAQKELDQARKNQEKAIREQQRAQKAQEMIDTATQVSSLVTATANIWKAFTGSGPWGIAAAIAATAVMFGSFAAAKIQAAKASRSTGSEEYGEGTVELLQGGSHQSGNDIDLGRKKDGTRRRAEGGEFFAVINKRNSRRYRNLIPEVINSLNDGTFAKKYMGAYDGNGMVVNVGQAPDISRLADDVHSIRKQGETGQYTDGNGNTVAQYKNLRRIIKR